MKSSILERAVAVVVASFAVTATACVSEDVGPGAAPATCDSYCNAVQANCTGANRQYRSVAECSVFCQKFAGGTASLLGVDTDTKRNTIGCRTRAARIATDLTSCLRAGPFSATDCSTPCESFCRNVDANCLRIPNAPYNTEADCIEACGSAQLARREFSYDATGAGETPERDLGLNNLNCRMHHYMLSLNDQAGHCPHTAINSATCSL